MWIEVGGKLVNLDHVIKVEKDPENKKISFFTDHNIISFQLDNVAEVEQIYFNLLALIGSKPIDGFRNK